MTPSPYQDERYDHHTRTARSQIWEARLDLDSARASQPEAAMSRWFRLNSLLQLEQAQEEGIHRIYGCPRPTRTAPAASSPLKTPDGPPSLPDSWTWGPGSQSRPSPLC